MYLGDDNNTKNGAKMTNLRTNPAFPDTGRFIKADSER